MGTPSPLFPITDPERHGKGKRWMRSLQRQIGDAWWSTVETDTHICRDHGMEAEAETVAISVAYAVTAIRVLDCEVFARDHLRSQENDMLSSPYEAFRENDAQGRVVSGMVLIRNAEIHLPVLIDPAVDRAISVPFPDVTRYRVFPVWVEYGALDRKIQANTRTNPRHHAAYKSDVEGHLVIETLLDAFGFFLRCDPSLARRTVDGELEHFPLPEIAQHEYERRHPEWPTRAEYDVQLRAELASQPPSGAERTILHRFLDPAEGSEVYVGSTRAEHGVRWAFTESAEQIARDLGFGFAYKIGAASLSIRADNTIMVGEDILNDVALPVPSVDATDGGADRSEKSWRALHRLVTEDACFYARQRRGS